MLVFSMLSLLCVVNNDIFKSVCFYVYTNARPPGGPCPPPSDSCVASRYAPTTWRFPPHISCITCNATHDVAHVQEVIVNHGECSMAMPAWVGGRCEIGNDRRYIPSSKCLLKNTIPHTANGHCKNPPTLGKSASHTCATSRKKKCYTLFARESLAWFLSPKRNFCRKTRLTTSLVPLRLITLELSESVINLRGTGNDHQHQHQHRHRHRH